MSQLLKRELVIIEAPPALPTSLATADQVPTPITSISTSQTFEPPLNNVLHQTRIWKPSQRVQDLIQGVGVTSNCQMDPRFAQGTPAPTLPTMEETAELEGKGLSKQMMAIINDELMDLEEEIVMVMEIADAKALEPSFLTEAKYHPDWCDWEHALAEELNMLHEAGT